MTAASLPKIGIISGIGPLAGADVLAKLFRNAAQLYGAIEDYEYPELVLVNHGIKGVDNTGALADRFQQELTDVMLQLENHGCGIIGIACNTAHVYFENLNVGSRTTLVNLIDVVSSAAMQADSKYLLLSSSTTKLQKLYHGYLEKYGVSFCEASPEQQIRLDTIIGLVMAHKLTESGALMDMVLASAKLQGCNAVIAGCTELPIAIAYSREASSMKVIDSNDELAKALLAGYYVALHRR